MAKVIGWNPEKYITDIANASMEDIEDASKIIVTQMKAELWGQVTGMTTVIQKDMHGNVKGTRTFPWKEHGRYQTGKNKDKIWTARHSKRAMVDSIRYVKKKDAFSNLFIGVKNYNIWIMAGNFKTWWAVQMEYGHGKWKGGAKPFFRSGINKSKGAVNALIAARNATRMRKVA